MKNLEEAFQEDIYELFKKKHNKKTKTTSIEAYQKQEKNLILDI